MKRYIRSSTSDISTFISNREKLRDALSAEFPEYTISFDHSTENKTQELLEWDSGRFDGFVVADRGNDRITLHIPDMFKINSKDVINKLKKKIDKYNQQRSQSPKKYVYDICDKLGWRAPSSINLVSGGYTMTCPARSKDEAEDFIHTVEDAANELGIDIVRSRVSDSDPNYPYVAIVVVPKYESVGSSSACI